MNTTDAYVWVMSRLDDVQTGLMLIVLLCLIGAFLSNKKWLFLQDIGIQKVTLILVAGMLFAGSLILDKEGSTATISADQAQKLKQVNPSAYQCVQENLKILASFSKTDRLIYLRVGNFESLGAFGKALDHRMKFGRMPAYSPVSWSDVSQCSMDPNYRYIQPEALALKKQVSPVALPEAYLETIQKTGQAFEIPDLAQN